MDTLKVTFYLDGSGVYYNPYEPPMIDGLLAWVNAPYVTQQSGLTRDEVPEDISLPLQIWRRDGVWGYHASALFPDSEVESLLMWRKKFRRSRIEMVAKGSPNLTMGPYREYNVPLPLVVCSSLVGWCVGDRRRVRSALKRIKFIGKKRAYGRGVVTGLEVERVSEDYSTTKNGVAMRYLPRADGARLVRMRPPYWNSQGRVPSYEIGEPINE